jgi:hypothetical protein
MPKTLAERQEAHRIRNEVRVRELRALIEALQTACELGRCPQLTNHLPDEPGAACAELTRRLQDKRLIVCKRE